MGGTHDEADARVHEAAGSGNGCDERATGAAGGNAEKEIGRRCNRRTINETRIETC